MSDSLSTGKECPSLIAADPVLQTDLQALLLSMGKVANGELDAFARCASHCHRETIKDAARLFAAAPEMLAIVRGLKAWMEEYPIRRSLGGGEVYSQICRAFDLASNPQP